MTLVPWQSGRSATWNRTIVHTLAASYVSQSAMQAGNAAAAASERKAIKYSNLSSSHLFFPVAVETLGTLADDGHFLYQADWQEGHTLHLRSAENYLSIPAYLHCCSEI